MAENAFGAGGRRTASATERNRSDGTLALLRTGSSVLAAGAVCVLIIYAAMGGIGPHGPTGNFAWLLLLTALMCLPFGCFLTLLGGAKWLRNRRESSAGR